MVVAMAVVSGFEATLKRSVQDVVGHLIVIKRGNSLETVEETVARIREVAPSVRAYTPYLELKAVLAHDKRINYVVVQGIEEKTVGDVLHIESRLIAGKFDVATDKEGRPGALIGKAIASHFNLQPGSAFKVVLPSPSRSDSTEFQPKVREFVVRGILDLGKHDYNERYIVTSMRAAQSFAVVGENFSGIRLRLDDPEEAARTALALERALGTGYFVMHWQEVNQNLFEAIDYEKPVLFMILLMMVVAASFNIASNLFISVLKRFADISILRAMGFSRRDVLQVFTLHGVLLGFLGTLGGIVLGLLLCGAFLLLQKFVVLMPPDIYKLDHVGVAIRFVDIATIVCASLLVSLISTLTPAFRGSRLDPVEGLRYE